MIAGEPVIRFNVDDGLVTRAVFSVDRVLKRHPELERLSRWLGQWREFRRRDGSSTDRCRGEAVGYTSNWAHCFDHRLSIRIRLGASFD
jgi:hypothetical protein